MAIDSGLLHHVILRHLVDYGHAPPMATLASVLGSTETDVLTALHVLQDEHGVVLHPHSSQVWVIHPFSLAPTNFWVQTDRMGWWGNCAWCSLGIAALIEEDCTITTTLGGHGQQAHVRICDGAVVEGDYFIHFPIPMKRAWDNVIYTCSTMLLFADDHAIDDWCVQHAIPKGDVQPVGSFWAFAQAWYGNHLDPSWTKWTTDEARELFTRFGLSGPIWEVPASTDRF